MTEKLVPGKLYQALGSINLIPEKTFWNKHLYDMRFEDYVQLERSEIILYIEEIYKDYNPFVKVLYYDKPMIMLKIYYATQLLEEINNND